MAMDYIPDALYASIPDKDSKGTLGFITPFNTDAAFEKRKATILSWSDSRNLQHSHRKTLTIKSNQGLKL